jgi:protein-S-isoprenylcysteine O-methyltransferase Ste14
MAGQAVEKRVPRGRDKAIVRNPLELAWWQPRFLTPVAAGVLVFALAEPTPASVLAGLPAVVGGEALRLWAAGHLHKTRELVTSGPYARIRHPLYAGTLAVASGFLAMAGVAVAAVGLPLFWLFFFAYYFPYKNRGEGARLQRRHGARYERWVQAVPALWPRLRPWPEADARAWSWDRMRENDETGTSLLVASLLALFVIRLLVAA